MLLIWFSLALSIATVAVWARSYWMSYQLAVVASRHNDLLLSFHRGEASLMWMWAWDQNPPAPSTQTVAAWNARGWWWRRVLFASWPTEPPTQNERQYEQMMERFGYIHRFGGFKYRNELSGNLIGSFKQSTRGIIVPAWSLATVLALPAVVPLWRRVRARRRQAEMRCRTCGYDLRATPTRCPECGTAVAWSSGSPEKVV